LRGEDLRRWRKALDFTQEQAGEAFDVTRATIQNWERGTTPIPKTITIASEVYLRRWKQRPEFGPVVLVRLDLPDSTISDLPEAAVVSCRPVRNNGDAFRQIADYEEITSLTFIMDNDGAVLWSGSALKSECEKYRTQLPRFDSKD
jgi:transcriptional regulator with XRE-family HTH domain